MTANMVKDMEKIMIPVSIPSREGTMECVACELQHKKQAMTHITVMLAFSKKTFDTYFKPHIYVLTIEACAYNSGI